MKPTIKQKIEEEALRRFPEDEYDDEYFTERYYFKEGAEYGYNIKESEDVEMNKDINIVLPSSTSACRYNVQVKSMTGQILFENTFYGDSKPLIKESEDVDWKKLREEFFNELVSNEYDDEPPHNLVEQNINIAPHDLFEWFKSKLTASNQENKNTYCDCEVGKCEGGKQDRCAFIHAKPNQENNEGWVSVKSALPKHLKECAFLLNNGNICIGKVKYFEHGDSELIDFMGKGINMYKRIYRNWEIKNFDGSKEFEVTHWMPLPKPLKEK